MTQQPFDREDDPVDRYADWNTTGPGRNVDPDDIDDMTNYPTSWFDPQGEVASAAWEGWMSRAEHYHGGWEGPDMLSPLDQGGLLDRDGDGCDLLYADDLYRAGFSPTDAVDMMRHQYDRFWSLADAPHPPLRGTLSDYQLFALTGHPVSDIMVSRPNRMDPHRRIDMFMFDTQMTARDGVDAANLTLAGVIRPCGPHGLAQCTFYANLHSVDNHPDIAPSGWLRTGETPPAPYAELASPLVREEWLCPKAYDSAIDTLIQPGGYRPLFVDDTPLTQAIGLRSLTLGALAASNDTHLANHPDMPVQQAKIDALDRYLDTHPDSLLQPVYGQQPLHAAVSIAAQQTTTGATQAPASLPTAPVVLAPVAPSATFHL